MIDVRLFLELLRREFTAKSGRAAFGMLWLLVDPLVNIFVLFVVVGLGMKKGQDSQIPFLLYLTIGVTVFTLFQRIVTQAATAFTSYSYLLKKVAFPFQILPAVKMFAAIIIMSLSMLLVVVIAFYYGFFPTLRWSVLLPWGILFLTFSGSVAYLACLAATFIDDIHNILSIFFRLGYWCTPIFWEIGLLPETIRMVVWLNPLTFFVESVRAIITGGPFTYALEYSFLAWSSVTVILTFACYLLFKKSRSLLLEAV